MVQFVSFTFPVNFIYCTSSTAVREPGYGPCSCGAVKVKVFFSLRGLCTSPGLGPRRVGYLVVQLLISSLFFSVGEVPHFPDEEFRLVICLNFRVFPSRPEKSLLLYNHQHNLNVIPADKNICLHNLVAFPNNTGIGKNLIKQPRNQPANGPFHINLRNST